MKRYSKVIFGLLIILVTVLFFRLFRKEFNDVIKIEYGDELIFYSDSYFRKPSVNYDSHLATLSMIATYYSMNFDRPRDINDNDWYKNQPKKIEDFFEKIGFNSFEANEDYYSRTTFDTIGLAIASKKIDDYTLIAVVPRSGGYFNEWANNFLIGDGLQSDYIHEGWYNAANKLIDFINDYLTNNNIKGKIKLWASGYSRGGAVVNIAIGLIDSKIEKNEKIFTSKVELLHDDIFAYTFESPKGANTNSKEIKTPNDEIYNNIWNIINQNDMFTKVPMNEFGFTRFGKDKYITLDPENRNTFKQFYTEKNDWSKYNADDFNRDVVDEEYEKYTVDKIETIILETLSKEIGNRDNYCNEYQEKIRDLLLIAMSDEKSENKDALSNSLKDTIANSFGFPNENKELVEDSKFLPFTKLLKAIIKDKPNEVLLLVSNMTSIFQNHDPNVTLAHIKAQDSYYIEEYNSNNKEKIKLISLSD